jgi:3',5'-cyclic AMP phosphodiesterase CpdA
MAVPRIDRITGSSGFFKVFAQAPGRGRVDITKFRGAPTQINSMSTTDPFGDATAQLSFPQITGFERPGTGDLFWLVPWVPIDIIWYNEDGSPSNWAWEGMQVSEDVGEDGYTISLKGALYELDNYLAAPWFPQYPVPYELLIKDAFDPSKHIGLRTNPLRVDWPEEWNVTVPTTSQPDYLWYLRPWGVSPGQKWTGRTSRNTGSWDPLLTGFVQSLLSVMYTEDGGQWTVSKEVGRTPVLRVRPEITTPDENTLHVWYGSPEVKLSVSRDFTQSTNIVYGNGTDLAGSVFSGQQVSRDGQTTYYEPFAALPYVWPATHDNPRINDYIVRKESRLSFPSGMSLMESKLVAASHLRKFSDPGYTGSLSLTTDPLRGGIPFNRMLIKAGMGIVVHGFRGSDVLFHISETTVSPMSLTATLTLDTKYRDALTVYEVQAKTRDALDPVRLLKAGAFSVTTQDQILPWSYTHGSGVVPSGGAFDATDFFLNKVGHDEKFPWVTSTTKYPPKTYPKYYIKIDPKNSNATKNWSGITKSGVYTSAIPIRLSQAGTIRLTQIAAYNKDGEVVPVKFHVAFYGGYDVTVESMPMIPASMAGTYGYPASQRYPFFPGAFENVNADGTLTDNPGQLLSEGANMFVGFGNYYEGAGYFPGSQSKGDPKTGMLSEEATWSYDTTSSTGFDKYSAEKTKKDPTNGLAYVMIYCDDQGTEPIYFLGRMFRAEG